MIRRLFAAGLLAAAILGVSSSPPRSARADVPPGGDPPPVLVTSISIDGKQSDVNPGGINDTVFVWVVCDYSSVNPGTIGVQVYDPDSHSYVPAVEINSGNDSINVAAGSSGTVTFVFFVSAQSTWGQYLQQYGSWADRKATIYDGSLLSDEKWVYNWFGPGFAPPMHKNQAAARAMGK